MHIDALKLVLAALAIGAAGQAIAGDWTSGRSVAGVAMEYRVTTSGFHEHRGEAMVCADLQALEKFVADTSRFQEWIPYTRSARLLDSSDQAFIYYVRSSTPWPMQDRDMVYEITRFDETRERVRLDVVGLPDFYPEAQNVTRIREASGRWYLAEEADRVNVSYQLYVDPGRVPAFAANRRLASVVGKTLANLAAHFPCTQF